MKDERTFDEAYLELFILVQQLESDKIQLDTLNDKVKEANELIEYCQKKLRNIEKKFKNQIG